MASERMSPVDIAWLHMDEPGNPADIVTLLIFDETVEYEGFVKAVEERLLKYERFKQLVKEVGGHPTWENDPDFHIDRHVSHRVHDAPLTEESLAELVAEVGNGQLPSDRPLWAMQQIDGSDGGTIVVSRMHHCIADGFALAHAMIKLADREDGTPMDEVMKPAVRPERQARMEAIAHMANEMARRPSQALNLAKQGTAAAGARS